MRASALLLCVLFLGCQKPVPSAASKPITSKPTITILQAEDLYAMRDAGTLPVGKKVQVEGKVMFASSTKAAFKPTLAIVFLPGSPAKVEQPPTVMLVFRAQSHFSFHFTTWLEGLSEGQPVKVTGTIKEDLNTKGDKIIQLVDVELVEY